MGNARRTAKRIVGGYTDVHMELANGDVSCGSAGPSEAMRLAGKYCKRCGNATSEGAPYCGSCYTQMGSIEHRRQREEAVQRGRADPGPTHERILRKLLAEAGLDSDGLRRWRREQVKDETPPVIPDDGFADGGEPYTGEEMDVIDGASRCGDCGERDCECEKCPECGDNNCDSDECRAMQMEPRDPREGSGGAYGHRRSHTARQTR